MAGGEDAEGTLHVCLQLLLLLLHILAVLGHCIGSLPGQLIGQRTHLSSAAALGIHNQATGVTVSNSYMRAVQNV